jgi:signal transduction histidine kinase
MKQANEDFPSVSPSPLTTQRAVLELQLPIALVTGLVLIMAGVLNVVAPANALVAVLCGVAALISVWLLRARLPVWSAQVAMLLFVLVSMWSGIGIGGDALAIITAGVVALTVIGLPADRPVQVLTAVLVAGLLLGAQWWLATAHPGMAVPLLLCAVLMAVAAIASLRAQIGSQDAAQQQADLLLGERERLLVDFRQRNEAFRRLVEKDAEQKALQLQRTNRELREANTHLESFNYMVSHDIRASLRVLDGLAKVLMEDIHGNRPVVALQNLNRLQSSIGNMHGMVQELLTMSRSDKSALRRRKVDLGAIMRELVCDQQTAEPQRQVSVEVADNLQACAQPDLIREVLQNLLCNAWKFTAQRADARIHFGVSEDGERVFYVRDNGVGFEMQRAAEVFQPFKRLHADQGYEGTGVGLASVKRIIERHGGRVWAMAEPGRGTRLCFTLGVQSVNPCEDIASVG